MSMGFASDERQLTIDDMMRQQAREAAKDAVAEDKVRSANQTPDRDTRDAIGVLAKLKPNERFALATLARVLARGMGKKGIKKKISRLLE